MSFDYPESLQAEAEARLEEWHRERRRKRQLSLIALGVAAIVAVWAFT